MRIKKQKNPIPAKMKTLLSKDYAVLDFETTGLDPKTCEPVSIAIVTKDGQEYSSLIKPSIAIPDSAMAIHGITDEMVQDAPTFADIYPKVKELLTGKTLVAYNAAYDGVILRSICKRLNLEQIEIENTYCAMLMVSAYRKHEGLGDRWIKLGRAVEYFGIETDRTKLHDALYDVKTTIEVMKALANKGE